MRAQGRIVVGGVLAPLACKQGRGGWGSQVGGVLGFHTGGEQVEEVGGGGEEGGGSKEKGEGNKGMTGETGKLDVELASISPNQIRNGMFLK